MESSSTSSEDEQADAAGDNGRENEEREKVILQQFKDQNV